MTVAHMVLSNSISLPQETNADHLWKKAFLVLAIRIPHILRSAKYELIVVKSHQSYEKLEAMTESKQEK